MFKKSIYIFLFFCMFSSMASAQFLDSILHCLTYPPRLDVRMDSRNSFITTQKAKIYGFKVGLVFNQDVKIGIGYNQLYPLHSKIQYLSDGNNKPYPVIKTLRFSYISAYMEYVFYKKNKWILSIPIQIGVGGTRYDYSSATLLTAKSKNSMLLVYEPVMIYQYKVIPFVALGLGIGYRLVLVGNQAVDENFTSPIYVMKCSALISDIIKEVRQNKNKTKPKAGN